MIAALYARVSTVDKEQNPETQLLALRVFCRDSGWQVYQEYVDQARANDYVRRQAWAQLLKDARAHKFKAVLVFRLDRAFRSVRECVNTVTDWRDRGIGFRSLKEDVIDTSTTSGRFVLQIMAAVAELESGTIGQRVRAGMERSRAEGHRLGRKPLDIPAGRICEVLQQERDVAAAARALKCSPGYIYKILRPLNLNPSKIARGVE